jgi:hypothetical protein
MPSVAVTTVVSLATDCARRCGLCCSVQARTTIAGLGKPITAVDVTYDGQWVIATTDDYVMVVNTSYKDNGKLSAT